MVDVFGPLSDPFTLRTVISIAAGAVTALIVVRLTFFLHNQRDLFKSVRAIEAELAHNVDQVGRLAGLLQDDLERQQIDLPLEVPAGTTIEVRYVIALPSALNTGAFDLLGQSGRLTVLPEVLRRELFDLYDVLDRINRLRQHREALHYNNIENVHIVIDAAALDVEPGTTISESDLPPGVRRRLDGLRSMRRAMAGVNTTILRLVAAVSSPSMIEDLELTAYVEDIDGSLPGAVEASTVPTFEELIDHLESFEDESFWARFV